MSDIDVHIAQILSCVESKSGGDIVDSLEEEFDEGALEDARGQAFELAHGRYLRQLRASDVQVGDNLNVNLQIKKRRGQQAKRAVARDLLELYMYANGHKQVFPKDTLTSVKNFVDIHAKSEDRVPAADPANSDSSSSIVGTRSKVSEPFEWHVKLAGLSTKWRLLKEEVDLQRHEKDMKIRKLAEEVGQMRAVIATLKGRLALCGQSDDHVNNSTQPANPSQPAGLGQLCAGQQPGNPSSQRGSINKESTAKQLTKQDTPDGSGEKTVGQPASERTNDATLPPGGSQPSGSGGAPPDSPPQASPPSITSPTYSEMVQIPGEWNLVANRSNKKKLSNMSRMEAREPNSTSSRATSPKLRRPKRTLRGCKAEAMITLYLEHIEMCAGDCDDDVVMSVREHGQEKGMRVTSAYIVKNRIRQDVVGCKITIPYSQADRAMSAGFWAEEITCRKWEKLPPKRSHTKNREPEKSRGSKDSRGPQYGDYEPSQRSQGAHRTNGHDPNNNRYEYEGDPQLNAYTYERSEYEWERPFMHRNNSYFDSREWDEDTEDVWGESRYDY